MSAENVSLQVLEFMREHKIESIIEAIVDFSKFHDIEVEEVAEGLDETIIAMMQEEGERMLTVIPSKTDKLDV